MRDPSGVVQELGSPVLGYQGGKDYATKVNFNCMATSGEASSLAIVLHALFTTCNASAFTILGATTIGHGAGDGYIVVGSEDGQIRMYSDKSLTRANTAIPGLGAPITAVDVTYDGKWVLATTRNYLMVVKTTYKVCSLPGMRCSAKFRSTPSVAIITQNAIITQKLSRPCRQRASLYLLYDRTQRTRRQMASRAEWAHAGQHRDCCA